MKDALCTTDDEGCTVTDDTKPLVEDKCDCTTLLEGCTMLGMDEGDVATLDTDGDTDRMIEGFNVLTTVDGDVTTLDTDGDTDGIVDGLLTVEDNVLPVPLDVLKIDGDVTTVFADDRCTGVESTLRREIRVDDLGFLDFGRHFFGPLWWWW